MSERDRPTAWAVPAVVVAVLLAASAPPGARAEAARAARVATRRVEPGPYDLTLPERVGPLRAVETRTLAFEVGGKLETLAEEGARIAAGGVVARLDDALEKAERRHARALLRTAESELGRTAELRRKDLVAGRRLEGRVTEVNVRRAELDTAEQRLARRSLIAPWSGVVVERHADPSEVVRPGQPVATFMNLDSLELRVGVPGYAIARVEPGQRVRVRVAGLAGSSFEGKVRRVAAAAPEGSHLFEVEIDVDSHGGRLRPGMTARAAIVVETLEGVVPIPAEAVVERRGRRVAFFVAKGHARAVDVSEAPTHRDRFLLHGPFPSDRLVVRGQRELLDGLPVRVDDRILESSSAAAP